MPETSHKKQKPVTKNRNQSQKTETSGKRSGTFAAHSQNIRRTFAEHSPQTKARQEKKEFKPFEIFI